MLYHVVQDLSMLSQAILSFITRNVTKNENIGKKHLKLSVATETVHFFLFERASLRACMRFLLEVYSQIFNLQKYQHAKFILGAK